MAEANRINPCNPRKFALTDSVGTAATAPTRSPANGWSASAREYSAGSAGFTGPRNRVPKRSAA